MRRIDADALLESLGIEPGICCPKCRHRIEKEGRPGRMRLIDADVRWDVKGNV